MAWVRASGGQSSSEYVLYKDGIPYISFDNPGQYTYSASATIAEAGEMASDRMKFANKNNNNRLVTIGTSQPIDFSKYKTLVIRGTSSNPTDASASFSVRFSTQKMAFNANALPGTQRINILPTYTTVDLTDISSTGYIIFNNYFMYGEIYEVYLI